MAFFEWQDKYDLGVGEMNDEHKTLIHKMNGLHDLNESGASKNKIIEAYDDFTAYTIKHFTDEEQYMESIDFPGLATHKLIHKGLLEKVVAFGNDFKGSSTGKFDDNFFSFLNVWLASHICGIDMKYGEHSKIVVANKSA